MCRYIKTSLSKNSIFFFNHKIHPVEKSDFHSPISLKEKIIK